MKEKIKNKKSITRVVTSFLFAAVAVTALITYGLTYVVMSHNIDKQSTERLVRNVEDVSKDIKALADNQYLEYLCSFPRATLGTNIDITKTADLQDVSAANEFLQKYGNGSWNVEMNVVNANAVIIASTETDNVGKSILDKPNGSDFLPLLNGTKKELVQNRAVLRSDGREFRYAGIAYDFGGFLQFGATETAYRDNTLTSSAYIANHRRIGSTGYLLICDANTKIISSPNQLYNDSKLETSGISIDIKSDYYYYHTQHCEMYGDPSYVCLNKTMGYYVVGVYPESEARENLNSTMLLTLLIEGIVYLFLFVFLVFLLKRIIVRRIAAVNESLSKITDGDLNEKVSVKDIYEFDMLSTDINKTVDRLKLYIAEEKAAIRDELTLARKIQQSVLPKNFPPYPERNEFELYACMATAKEVGGDMYDFYLIDNDTLAVMIGDVSGKGIPGGMFMMAAKLMIKGMAETKIPVNEVLTEANRKLCEENDAEMFITAWLGFLDLKTGMLRFANAGHNPPVLIRDGRAAFIEQESDFVLAGIENTEYTEQKIQLLPDDIIYLYTDGVTEAKNRNGDLFTEGRLKSLLSNCQSDDFKDSNGNICENMCELVSKDIEKFTDGFERSDDISMLCLKYNIPNEK